MRDAVAVIEAIRRYRFRWNSERDLQDGIEVALKRGGFAYERERSLEMAGIVDFLVAGGVAVEVKVDGSPVDVLRQLIRYADRPEVRAVVLVTAQRRLGRVVSGKVRGKPAYVVDFWKSAL